MDPNHYLDKTTVLLLERMLPQIVEVGREEFFNSQDCPSHLPPQPPAPYLLGNEKDKAQESPFASTSSAPGGYISSSSSSSSHEVEASWSSLADNSQWTRTGEQEEEEAAAPDATTVLSFNSGSSQLAVPVLETGVIMGTPEVQGVIISNGQQQVVNWEAVPCGSEGTNHHGLPLEVPAAAAASAPQVGMSGTAAAAAAAPAAMIDSRTGKLICSMCRKLYANSRSLKVHMEQGHGQQKKKKLVCPQCPKSFSTKGNLKTHQEKVHEDCERLGCDFCEKSFKTRGQLKDHEDRMHVIQVCRRDNRVPLVCACGELQASTRGMSFHLRSKVHKSKLRPE